jgi:hypothetical protein
MSRFTVDPPEPVSPTRRILSRGLQWLSLAFAGIMVAGYFGLFGDSEFTRMSWFAVGMVGIFACLILGNAAAGFATVTETMWLIGMNVSEVFRPTPSRQPSGRVAPPSRRRRLGWWAWLALVVLSLGGAFLVPSSGPDKDWPALLGALVFLLLVGGWLVRLKQVWGGWILLGWLATLAVLTGVSVGMASVIGDHNGWLVVPGVPLVLVGLFGFFALFSGTSGADGSAGGWAGDFADGGGGDGGGG